MHKTSIAIASLTFALFLTPAMAKPFTQLWVFGDSSVDSGSFRVAPYTGDSFVDFYLAPTFPFNSKTGFQKWGIGKPTSNPGLMNSEELALLLGVTASPQNQHGTNYAFSGARNSMIELWLSECCSDHATDRQFSETSLTGRHRAFLHQFWRQ
jgi:hypothetical protein